MGSVGRHEHKGKGAFRHLGDIALRTTGRGYYVESFLGRERLRDFLKVNFRGGHETIV